MKKRFWFWFAVVAVIFATNGILEVWFPALLRNDYSIISFLMVIPLFFISNSVLDWRNGQIVKSETASGRTVVSKGANPAAFYTEILGTIVFSVVAILILISGILEKRAPNQSPTPTAPNGRSSP